MNDLPYLVISIDEKPNLENGLNLDKTYVYCDPGFATGPAGVTAMFVFVFIMQACISRSSRPGNATFSFIRKTRQCIETSGKGVGLTGTAIRGD